MEDKKLNSDERKTMAFASTAHALVHSFMLIFPAVLIPIMNEFDLTSTEGGFLVTFSYLMFGLGALPAGWLTDHFGSRGLIVICMIGSGLSAIFIGYSESYFELATGLVLLGAFTSIYHPAGLALISRRIRNRPRALGYHGIFGNIGLAGAPFVAGIISSIGEWRDAYLLFGLISLIAATYFLIRPVSERTIEDIQRNSEEVKTKFREVIILFSATVIFGFIYRGTLTFMPYLFTHNVTQWTGIDPIAIGGSVTAAALLVGTLGQWFGGRVAEKYSLTLILSIIWAILIPTLLLMGIFEQYLLIIIAFIFTLVIFASQPVGNTLLAKYISMKSKGKGYGLNIAIGFGIGSFAAPVCGYIAEKTSPGGVFIFLGLLAPIGLVLSIWLNRIERKKLPARLMSGGAA